MARNSGVSFGTSPLAHRLVVEALFVGEIDLDLEAVEYLLVLRRSI